jgi:hypothetical protein
MWMKATEKTSWDLANTVQICGLEDKTEKQSNI